MDALRKFEFNNLSNEQKYSTLITLMKYLMPLISNEKAVLKPNNFLEKYNTTTDRNFAKVKMETSILKQKVTEQA